MGAGCWYTLTVDNTERAFWYDLGEDERYEDEHEWLYNFLLELDGVESCDANTLYYKDCFKIKLEPNYNGDGIIINLEDSMTGCENYYELMLSKVSSIYKRIIKHVNEVTALRIATSGYTSGFVHINKAYK